MGMGFFVVTIRIQMQIFKLFYANINAECSFRYLFSVRGKEREKSEKKIGKKKDKIKLETFSIDSRSILAENRRNLQNCFRLEKLFTLIINIYSIKNWRLYLCA